MDSSKDTSCWLPRSWRIPNFARSIVLLIEHNEQGALGVIPNRPTSKTVGELWREVSQVACRSQQPICLGGPVPARFMALHTVPDLAEVEIIAGVYFAAKKQHLDRLVQQAESAAGATTNAENPPEIFPPPGEPLQSFKISWAMPGGAPANPSGEIQQRAWYTIPARIEHVFDPDPDLWERLVQALDRVRLARLLKIKHIPPDPGLNRQRRRVPQAWPPRPAIYPCSVPAGRRLCTPVHIRRGLATCTLVHVLGSFLLLGQEFPYQPNPQVVEDGHEFRRCGKIAGQMLDLSVDSCENQVCDAWSEFASKDMESGFLGVFFRKFFFDTLQNA